MSWRNQEGGIFFLKWMKAPDIRAGSCVFAHLETHYLIKLSCQLMLWSAGVFFPAKLI